VKIINSKIPNKDLLIFTDSKTKEYSGFAGTVELYDSSIYIDTRNGIGNDEVIKKLMPLIHKLMRIFRFNGNTANDTKHDIIVHILEGIPRYDPRKNTKLSTFIETAVCNRLKNRLRDKSRISKNANYLNVCVYHIVCNCGNDFTITVSNGEEHNTLCPECGKPISEAKKKVAVNTPEVSESMLNYIDDDSHVDMSAGEHYSFIRNETKTLDEEVIHTHDIKAWLESEDPRIVKIIELIYFHDYSIKAAAEEVGLSGAGANMKLKDLQNKEIVRELFGR
jgi:RNA polymerase sigma factor (sigma-70 family)